MMVRRWLATVVASWCITTMAGERQPPSDAPARLPPDGSFSFSLVGDVPYSRRDEAWTRQVLEAVDPLDQFVVHIGDLKAGDEPCDDALLTRRRDLLEQSARVALVYVPGDNDWADCHRRSAGGYAPFERLDRVRRLFFSGRSTLGPRGVAAQQQIEEGAHWPENRRWRIGNTLFVTLNRPGGLDVDAMDAGTRGAYEALERANERWLEQAFAHATRARVSMLMILAHANPRFERDRGFGWGRIDPHRAFRSLLLRLTQAFEGTVVLIHGDTHRFRHDRPLLDERGEALRNFWRVESFGWPYTTSWVRVVVTPGVDPGFSVQTRMLTAPPSPGG